MKFKQAIIQVTKRRKDIASFAKISNHKKDMSICTHTSNNNNYSNSSLFLSKYLPHQGTPIQILLSLYFEVFLIPNPYDGF